MSKKIRIEIDLEACTGHGRCYELASNLFTDDERGYGQVIDSVIGPELMEEARSAAGACPERAILLNTVAEDEG